MIRWLLIGSGLAFALLCYVLADHISDLNRELANAERDFAECAATLSAFIEGGQIDDTIPLDLDGFDIPDAWRVPLGE